MLDTAIILAGGQGTRLRSVVNDRPKVMALVAGRPFITHLLDQLVSSGVRRVILCTGYMADFIQDELGEDYRGLELIYSREESPLGTAGALRQAVRLIIDKLLLVMNGDSWCECSLPEFERNVIASGLPGGMVLGEVPDVARFGAVETDTSGRIVSFREKGEVCGRGWVNAGIYLLPTRQIMQLQLGRQISLERELMPQLLSEGIRGHRVHGDFIDIGIPEEFQRAQVMFQDSLKRLSLKSDTDS